MDYGRWTFDWPAGAAHPELRPNRRPPSSLRRKAYRVCRRESDGSVGSGRSDSSPIEAPHAPKPETRNPKPETRSLRIGVYGGSYDPIHNAHLEIARVAMREADLDRVLFIVAGNPPHKQEGTLASAEDRFAMVEAAVADEPGMAASRLELDRQGPSYTVDTLRALEEHYPSAELFLILGMDSLVDLPGWRDPEGILARAFLLVLPRPGEWTVPEALEGKYRVLPFEQTTLSSTDVRARLINGEPVSDVLPDAVLRIIREKGIYGVAC